MLSTKGTRRLIRLSVIFLLLAAAGSAILAGRYEKQKGQWTVTQYGFPESSQFMFYTLINGTGDLIVVDGGYDVGEAYVREIITELGGVVDAWIVTHPHPDHAGAFNKIYAKPNGIKIKQVYATRLNAELYEEKAQEWDGIETFREFLEVTEGKENIEYLQRGEELIVCGLRMKVLNAYDDKVEAISEDLCNDGSLMFKISGKEKSMLFCADVGGVMSETILQDFGEELEADYVQMGHHGNGGMIDLFYERTMAEAAFFDAPNWLAYGENYSTSGRIKFMQLMGAEVYTYATAPNTVKLY